MHATVQSVVLVFAFLLTQSILGLVPSPPPPTPQDCQPKSILLVRFPYGVGMMSSQPSAPVQYTGQPTGPGGQVRPLFPSAQPGTPSPGPPASRATFPAYSSESEPEKKPQLIASTGSSSKIIHPPQDISLEEMRASMPQYKAATMSSTIILSGESQTLGHQLEELRYVIL